MAALAQTTITRIAAATSIARTAGAQGDSDQLTVAAEVLRDVITAFNNMRDWTFLQTTASANLSGATLTAPSRMKKVYSFITPTTTLMPVTERERNRLAQPGTLFGNTFFYEVFDVEGTSLIRVYDAPTTTLAITLNYVRLLTLPANDTDVLDFPEKVMPYILAQSKAVYLANKGGAPERLQFWAGYAMQLLADLKAEDARQSDREDVFQASNADDYQMDWLN